MIEGDNPVPQRAAGIAVAIRVSDPTLHNDIRSFIARLSGFALVTSSSEADVVVTDVLPELDEVAVVIGGGALIGTAVEHGWAGLLRHQIDSESLRIAVEAAHHGLVCMPRSAAAQSQNDGSRFDDSGDEFLSGQALSARERQVLELLADGAANKVIARRLDISVHTAKFHVASVIAKLGATGRTEAVALAIRHGLIHL